MIFMAISNVSGFAPRHNSAHIILLQSYISSFQPSKNAGRSPRISIDVASVVSESFLSFFLFVVHRSKKNQETQQHSETVLLFFVSLK